MIKKTAGHLGLALAVGGLVLILAAIFTPKIQLVENKTVEACIIPPGYLQEKSLKPSKEIIIKKIFVKSPQRSFIKPQAKTPHGQCLQAASACKADKGCHAKGCVELGYYYRALRGFSK